MCACHNYSLENSSVNFRVEVAKAAAPFGALFSNKPNAENKIFVTEIKGLSCFESCRKFSNKFDVKFAKIWED